MQDRLLLGFLEKITISLDNIDKTLSEPKNISAHRIAANRRISAAMEYIAKLDKELDHTEMPRSDQGEYLHVILKDIKKILNKT